MENRGEMVAEYNSGGKILEEKMATTQKEGQVRIKQEAMDVQTKMRDHFQTSDAKVSCAESQESGSIIEIDVESGVKGEEQDFESDTEQKGGVEYGGFEIDDMDSDDAEYVTEEDDATEEDRLEESEADWTLHNQKMAQEIEELRAEKKESERKFCRSKRKKDGK